MSLYKTKLIARSDSTANWESLNPILKVAEIGYAIDAGKVTCMKVGLGLTWNNTPVFVIPFEPIVTTTGRDLDSPAAPYNASHNFVTEKEAWDYVLNPYSPPSVVFGTKNIATIEVGATYNNAAQAMSVTFKNTPSIHLEGGKKVFFKDEAAATIANENGTSIELTDQVSNDTNQTITKSVVANRNTTGTETVLTVSVRGKKGYDTVAGIFSDNVTVTFQLRSAYFLWRSNDELFAKTDVELSALVRGIGADLTGVRRTFMSGGNGSRAAQASIQFNTATLTSQNPLPQSAVGNDGFFDIVIAAPVSAGTPILFNPAAGATSPITLQTHDFEYSNGTATVPYRLYKTLNADKIVGTFTATIQ